MSGWVIQNGPMNKSERDLLALRRQAILSPRSGEALSRLWPPEDFAPATPGGTGNVAVVADRAPDPGGYDPVARHAAELLSALVCTGARPVFLDLGPANRCAAVRAALARHWPQGAVCFQPVPPPAVPPVRGLLGPAVHAAYRLHGWLKQRDFDVVHGADGQGFLYYCLRAKEQGLAFARTRFVVHHPTGMLSRCLEEYRSFDTVSALPGVYLEQASLELADFLPVSGPAALRRLLDAGVSPTAGRIRRWPLPFDRLAAARAFPAAGKGGEEAPFRRVLCLAGASRRGIALFCAAMKRGFPMGMPVSVEFAVPAEHGHEFRSFVQALTDGGNRPAVAHEVRDRSALAALLAAGPRTLCVFPVVDDWNRYQLRDLAAAGAALLVADQGGAAEILAEDGLTAFTCQPLPDAIAKHLHARLQNGQAGTPQLVPEAAMPAPWLESMPAPAQVALPQESPLVTVCLMHFERPHLVEQALASVEQQTHAPLEVVLVDDGSLKPETEQKLAELEARFAGRGWRLVRQPNLYLGAARNTAALEAQGRYLYFLDDDNILKPHALETLVGVAERTGADVVTAFADEFTGQQPPASPASASRRIIQIGDDLAYGLFRNGFGDSNALIRRDAFLELGGNTEDYGVGLDDHEFFARAVLHGRRLTIVPEALYWARQMPSRLRNLHFNANAGHVRVLRAYLPHVPPKLRPMLFLAIGQEQALFAGNVLRHYLRGRLRRLVHTPLGRWLRFVVCGPLMRGIRERFRRDSMRGAGKTENSS